MCVCTTYTPMCARSFRQCRAAKPKHDAARICEVKRLLTRCTSTKASASGNGTVTDCSDVDQGRTRLRGQRNVDPDSWNPRAGIRSISTDSCCSAGSLRTTGQHRDRDQENRPRSGISASTDLRNAWHPPPLPRAAAYRRRRQRSMSSRP